jgi:hypothetical protein
MTPALQKYYEDRFSLMVTAAWADLVEDLENMKKPIEELSTIKTVDDLYFRKGQLDILNWLLSLKAVSELAYEELKNEDTL